MYATLILFFFSSRRRHTRLQGDWSSDVCSSDLHPDLPPAHGMHVAQKGSTDFTASKPPSDLVVSTLVWREQMTAQSMQPTGNTTVSPVQLADQQPSAVVLAQLDTSNTQPGAARSEERR